MPTSQNMANQHFSHPHTLSFHKSLEAANLVCTGCNFPCAGTPVYSCRPCKFFLHDQCFNAARSLTHPSHPSHPLSLFPSPTYPSGSFKCNSCNKPGSGLCFGCSTCDYDLHVHCAYNTKSATRKEIRLKAHPNHPLHYVPKPPYDSGNCTCDVCGIDCDPNGGLYHCDVCGYDVHLGCVDLPETVKREDHEHVVTLLHVNPSTTFECDFCGEGITQNHSMYHCGSGCNYGMHVKCVDAKVTEKAPMDALAFQVEMFKLQNQMRVHDMAVDTMLMGARGLHRNRYYRY